MGRVMDGNFSFLGGEVLAHDAPEWSIDALKTVAVMVGESLKVLANPASTDQEINDAVEAVLPNIKDAAEQAPPRLRDQVLEALSFVPASQWSKSKKRVALGLAVAMALLLNYQDIKGNVVELYNDASAAIEWISAHAHDLSEEVIVWLAEAATPEDKT